MSKVKAIILVGGPSKGTRFRPLSLDLPKPLFPIAGKPIIDHHLEQLAKQLKDRLLEVLVIGFYEPSALSSYIKKTAQSFNVPVRYLAEPKMMGTAGGLSHFKKDILQGNPDQILVLHGDIASSFPVDKIVNFHQQKDATITLVGTRVKNEEASHFGCIVADEQTQEVIHYAEKPETLVSNLINCGIYCLKPAVLEEFQNIKNRKKVNTQLLDSQEESKQLRFENDILAVLAGEKSLYVYELKQQEGEFWQQIKTANSIIQTQQIYMTDYKVHHPERLATKKEWKCEIVGNVVIDETAEIDPSAKIGPNVAIGAGAKIGKGVRVVNSIILDGTEVKDHAFVSYSVIGWNSTIGLWTRVEGTPNFSYHEPYATENKITIFGAGVKTCGEIIVRNCIVLPHKELSASVSNRILL